MKGHCILSHGFESGPDATKVTALAEAAERLGWSHERPDYTDLDARREAGELGDVPARLERLLGLARDAASRGPLVLAGSSLGAWISGRVSLQVPARALFLMAPPVAMAGAPPLDAAPTWSLSLLPLPTPQGALRLHACETRLAMQPALAGIKHCNRLEQVLGRADAERASCDEGLMRDMAGNPVCATSANLLVLRDGRWTTPPLDACGVAGVLRGWLLDEDSIEVAAVSMDDAESAEALALCNAVRGILPVRMLGVREWLPHPAVSDLRKRLAMAYPMFSESREPA